MIYRIWQRINGLGDFVKIKEVTDEKETTIKNLSPKTKYEFAISAWNGLRESNRSNVVAITTGEIPVDSITLTIDSLKPEKGQTVQATVKISPSDATSKNVTFSSSNTSVATVDGKGRITAVAVGKTVISAKADNGKSASLEIQIFEALVTVRNLKASDITATSATLTWE